MSAERSVLFISEHFPERLGGTSLYSETALESIAQFGVKGEIITYYYGESPNPSPYIRLTRIRVPEWLRRERYFPLFGLLPCLRSIVRNRPCLIHVLHGYFAAGLGTFLGKVLRIPVIITIHNLATRESVARRDRISGRVYGRLLLAIDRLICRLDANIVCPSAYVGESVRRINPNANVTSIPIGLDTRKFESRQTQSASNGPIQILSVGGLIRHKGQDVLIRALAGLRELIAIECRIIGEIKEPAFAEYCERLISEFQLQDSVELLPTQPRGVLDELFQQTDIYVQPSREEGFCLTVLEALLFGLPVVGTRTGAIPEMLQDGRGLLIPTDDPGELGDAILRLAIDSHLRMAIGLRGRRYATRRHSLDQFGRSLLSLYEDVTGSVLSKTGT